MVESHGIGWTKHVFFGVTSHSASCSPCSWSVSSHWPMQIAVAAFLILVCRCLRPGLSATSGSLLSNSENMWFFPFLCGCYARGNLPCVRASPLGYLCSSASKSWGTLACLPPPWVSPSLWWGLALLCSHVSQLLWNFYHNLPGLVHGGERQQWQGTGPFFKRPNSIYLTVLT